MRETVVGMASAVVATLWRDGGQRQARRNAWAAMVSDHLRAKARAEAEAAVREMQPTADLTVAASPG